MNHDHSSVQEQWASMSCLYITIPHDQCNWDDVRSRSLSEHPRSSLQAKNVSKVLDFNDLKKIIKIEAY